MDFSQQYKKLEYLEATGTQWLNSSVNPLDYDSQLTVQADLQFTAVENLESNKEQTFVGVITDTSELRFGLNNDNHFNIFSTDVITNSDIEARTVRRNITWQIRQKEQLITVDGSTNIINKGVINESPDGNLYIFAPHIIGDSEYTEEDYASVVKLYSLSIKDTKTGAIIRNFTPVLRISDGSVGLYDTVTNSFYQNQGSGRFSYKEKIDEKSVLKNTQYDLEIWDWKTGTYVADISNIVVDGLNFAWTLNDIETLDFTIDLIQFEKKCNKMGVTPAEVLTPYVHDIRVRRNGEYIMGVQVVETNINISNNTPPTIEIKCTGFLNLFKDQYITDSWSGYTYAEIARKLVEGGQSSDSLISNSTIDIDSSYWLAANGTISYSQSNPHSGDGCLSGTRSGTGYITFGTQISCEAGTPVKVDLWVKGQSGITTYIRERQLVTQSNNQLTIHQFTTNGSWQHVVIEDYTTFFDDGYLVIEHSRTDSSTPLCVDDVYVYAQDDDARLCDLNVSLGIDTASENQSKTRQRAYSLQNIKDAIIELTALDEDNFDFDFSADRTFNVYSSKGIYKSDVELCYPGNVDSMTITRTASNMANKVINIGSGIGDQRLQVVQSNRISRLTYGTRESIITNNNVSLKQTLINQAVGELWDRKDPTDLPKITIRDGSVNPSNVQVGDYLLVRVQDDNFLGTVNGVYRVVEFSMNTDLENVETVDLTLEPPVERPALKQIRYIKDTINGNSVNTTNHWIEIEALMLVGNDYVNVALGKPIIGSKTISNSSRITNGSLSPEEYASGSAGETSVTIDLGAEYPVDYIQVWHYFNDGRTYHSNVLSVGNELKDGTLPLDEILWSYDSSHGYVETSAGRKSKWLQAGD